MSALWILPALVLVAGAAGAAVLTRRLADDVAALHRDAGVVRELVEAAEAAMADTTAATSRGREVADLRARVAALRRPGGASLPAPGDR